MDKLIFLDIDGVMNSHAWMCSAGHPMKSPKGEGHFDPQAVDCLNRIVRWTGAQVVVASSAWGQEEVEQALQVRGFTGAVIGHVPKLWSGYEYQMRRGFNIQRWINQNPGRYRFVILDDSGDVGHLRPWLIKTTWLRGLTDLEANLAIEMLNRSV